MGFFYKKIRNPGRYSVIKNRANKKPVPIFRVLTNFPYVMGILETKPPFQVHKLLGPSGKLRLKISGARSTLEE